MNSEWKEFLISTGASFDAAGTTIEHFGAAQREREQAVSGSVLCDLSHLVLIAARGADTQSFLQSQLTNDAREISATRSQLSGYCTAKGRLLALFRIFLRGDATYLQFPLEIMEPTLKRLRMFVMRSKVTLENVSETLGRIGFSGPEAEVQLRAALGSTPQAVNEVVETGSVTVVRLPGVAPRFELIGDFAPLRTIWQQLAAHATPVGADAWRLLDIRAGVPEVFKSSVEEFIPQMVNLTALEAVNFKKGCYPGQEIVARMQYLGTLKRRMYLVHVDATEPPAPTTPLFETGGESAQGHIVHAQRAPQGGCDALAVVVIAAAERGAIRLGTADGPVLKFESLPYSLE